MARSVTKVGAISVVLTFIKKQHLHFLMKIVYQRSHDSHYAHYLSSTKLLIVVFKKLFQAINIFITTA